MGKFNNIKISHSLHYMLIIGAQKRRNSECNTFPYKYKKTVTKNYNPHISWEILNSKNLLFGTLKEICY